MATKQEVLDQIRKAHAALLATIEGLPPDAMLRPGVVGIWSVKDVLAHLVAWQSEIVTALARLDQPKLAPAILQIEDIDEWNQQLYQLNARLSLDIVLEDFLGVHKHLLKAVESLDDKLLNDVRRFQWMEGEPLWYLIAENGYWHEREHTEQIQAWRQAEGI